MTCTCSSPGYCQRHNVVKSPHLHKLCQSREDYFRAWEDGRGPGQTHGRHGQAKGATVDARSGPGAELSKLLAERGYSIKHGCGCSDKSRQMDRWGAAGCRERLDEIVGWLAEAAKSAGWLERISLATPGIRRHALGEIRALVLAAIEKSEASQRQVDC